MIYLYLYIAFVVVVLWPLFCWYTYVTSFDRPEYRYLRIGDILCCLFGAVIPGLNLIGIYTMIMDMFEQGFLSDFFNIAVFKGRALD